MLWRLGDLIFFLGSTHDAGEKSVINVWVLLFGLGVQGLVFNFFNTSLVQSEANAAVSPSEVPFFFSQLSFCQEREPLGFRV